MVDLVYTLASAVDHFMNASPPLVAGIVCLLIAGIPVRLLHEWGHAFAARDLLGEDTRIHVTVGHAGKLAEFRLGEISHSIHLFTFPSRVAAVAQLDLSRATARDVFWIAVAGPGVSAVGLLVTGLLYSAAPEEGVLHGVLWAALFEGFAAVGNLIPFTIQRRKGVPFRSDGRLALEALRVASRAKRSRGAASSG